MTKYTILQRKHWMGMKLTRYFYKWHFSSGCTISLMLVFFKSLTHNINYAFRTKVLAVSLYLQPTCIPKSQQDKRHIHTMFVQTSCKANYPLMKSIISRAQISKKTKDTSAHDTDCRWILQPRGQGSRRWSMSVSSLQTPEARAHIKSKQWTTEYSLKADL